MTNGEDVLAGEVALPPVIKVRVLNNGDVVYRINSAGIRLTCRYSPAYIKEQISRLIDDKFSAALREKKLDHELFIPGSGLKLAVEAKHGRITPIGEGRYTDEEIEQEKIEYVKESYRYFDEKFPRELSEVLGVFLLKVTTAAVANMSREGMLGLSANSKAGLIDAVFEELKRKFKQDWEATKRGNPNFVLKWPKERIIEFGKIHNRLLKELQGALTWTAPSEPRFVTSRRKALTGTAARKRPKKITLSTIPFPSPSTITACPPSTSFRPTARSGTAAPPRNGTSRCRSRSTSVIH